MFLSKEYFLKRDIKRITRGLKEPKTQLAEALLLLMLAGPKGITRRDAMVQDWILNFPSLVHRLRRKGAEIDTRDVKTVNRFGRNISFAVYSIPHTVKSYQAAADLYEKINHY